MDIILILIMWLITGVLLKIIHGTFSNDRTKEINEIIRRREINENKFNRFEM